MKRASKKQKKPTRPPEPIPKADRLTNWLNPRYGISSQYENGVSIPITRWLKYEQRRFARVGKQTHIVQRAGLVALARGNGGKP